MKKIFHMHGGASRTCLKPKKRGGKYILLGTKERRKNKIVEELI